MALAFALAAVAAGPLAGQQPDTAAARRQAEQRLGHPVSQEEMLQRVRDSGLTRSEAKARLLQLGYDPSMVDPYYDALEGTGPVPTGSDADRFPRALDQIKRAPRVQPGPLGGAGVSDSAAVDTTVAARGDSSELPMFGRDLFSRATTEFEPVLYGPVDESYRLGPGDEVLLVLTGGVESAYSLEVNRQGYIVVPDVGQIAVNGMSVGQLETALGQALGEVYAGVRGPDPTVHFQVSLGRLRTNQVYLVGEVERPGAYQVSAVATVFNALYQAGGPKRGGSFRNVEVWRGGRIVGTIDLYDYLISGDSRNDIRLEQGDRIYVPLAGPRAAVRGEVQRPAIYELKEGEQLRDLLGYAGGFKPDAVVRRVQVDRILPPAERRPGADRVLVDVDVAGLLSGDAQPVPVRAGDVVEVFAISSERRDRVDLTGDVRRPGTYEWSPGLTLRQLLSRADGLDESAYVARAHIFRLVESTGERRLISVALTGPEDDGAIPDAALADRDSVVIYSREHLRTPRYVHIAGYVKNPGTYSLAGGMTLEDLILTAGGFTDGAFTTSAEVARAPADTALTDTAAVVLNVPLAGGPALDAAATPERGMPAWRPDPSEFRLQHGDRVFIRKAPGHRAPQTVTVTGEVRFPGEYVLSRRSERLSDVLRRAGGLTRDGYVPGIRVVRGGKLVAVDAMEALGPGGGPVNLVLEAGDSLQVPTYDPTVLVVGAVRFESRVLYQAGRSVDYYIQQAGGYGELADRDRVTVTYQNGERASANDVVLLFRRAPSVSPGSTIQIPTLPARERQGFNWDAFLSRTLSLASVTATLLLAINQLQ